MFYFIVVIFVFKYVLSGALNSCLAKLLGCLLLEHMNRNYNNVIDFNSTTNHFFVWNSCMLS